MLTRFLYEAADASLIDGSGIQPDPELAARNLERAREKIKQMGSLWCCYLPDRDAEEELFQQHMQEMQR